MLTIAEQNPCTNNAMYCAIVTTSQDEARATHSADQQANRLGKKTIFK
jgi:hypothetical protein